MDSNGRTAGAGEKGPMFTEEEMARVERARGARNTVVTSRPQSLGYLSIACLIINRMIGTGIFRTPTVVMQGTSSVGISLILWVLGAVVAMAGVFVFSELGLTIPRMQVEGARETECVPRNGGEKNYLEYLCKKPAFFATCLYGIPFIVLGNTAGNAIFFAENVILASRREPTNAEVRGIAIAVITFACLIHAVWRRGGLHLNNFFGLVKAALLLMLFVVGVASAAGAINNDAGDAGSVARENFDPSLSFRNRAVSSYGYAEAFLAIIFAYGGFNQANYVLGEIDDPRRKFKPAALLTVGFVSIFYILVNISYMLVVPASDQNQTDSSVTASFFGRIFGQAVASQVLFALMAFSSLGNVVVQTFTAARVKQEIAKEGILPYSAFFARNFDVRSIFRGRRRSSSREAHMPGGSGREGSTPAGAFLLHWLFAAVLILASIPQSPDNAYKTYVNIYSFTIEALFCFLVGLGLLYLRLNEKHTHWSTKSTSTPWLSVCAAAVFMVGNLFPLVGIWIPPERGSVIVPTVSWFVAGTVGLGVLGVGALWWLGLVVVLPRVRGMRLEVEKEAVLDNGYGYWIMWHEIVRFSWVVG